MSKVHLKNSPTGYQPIDQYPAWKNFGCLESAYNR